MQYFFAKSTMGFYVDDVHGDNMPPDAVPLALEDYQALLEGQASGKVLSATDDGQPYLTDFQAIPFTYAQLRASEYPPMADYLDGVVKGDQAQIDAYIAACQAVKAKYPKP